MNGFKIKKYLVVFWYFLTASFHVGYLFKLAVFLEVKLNGSAHSMHPLLMIMGSISVFLFIYALFQFTQTKKIGWIMFFVSFFLVLVTPYIEYIFPHYGLVLSPTRIKMHPSDFLPAQIGAIFSMLWLINNKNPFFQENNSDGHKLVKL